MKITQISVTYGRKFNLDDYESLHLEMTYWAELEEGDGENDLAMAESKLWSLAKNNVKLHAMPVLEVRDRKRKALSQQVEEAYGAD